MSERRVASPDAVAIVMAQLVEIETRLVSPYALSSGVQSTTRAVLVKLTDADGVVGWGEANPSPTFSGETTASVIEILSRDLLPVVFACESPTAARVDAELDGLLSGSLCAKGAISMALLDLSGKRLGVPVSTLLGGAVRSSLRVLWPLSNGSAETDIPVIDDRLANGFTTFMLKMGSSPIDDEIDRVARLQRRYGTDIQLIPDANQGWSRADAARFLGRCDPDRIVFVEQPLARDDLDGMASLSAGTDFALSADESVISLDDAAAIATARAARVFSIKSSKNGGPLRAQRIASLAEGFGITTYMNSMIEFGITQAASLQHAMTVRNPVDAGHAFMSTLRIVDDPTDFSSLVTDGEVVATGRPGLGVDVDEERVLRLAVRPPEIFEASTSNATPQRTNEK